MRIRREAWLCAAAVILAACGGSPLAPPPPEAPAIVCPADVSARGLPGGAGEVSYPAPATSGGILPLAVTCTPASGSRFLSGTTPVGCVVTDGRGRQAACAFSVTVTPLILSATRFIAFGDSLTEGENGRPTPAPSTFIDLPNIYPIKLEALLNDDYPGQGIVVLNRGAGGAFVEQSVDQLPRVLERDHGDVLLLLDGYNNLLSECTPDRPGSAACAGKIADVVSGLRECVRIAGRPAYGVRYVLVSTLTPPGPFAGGPRDRRIAADAILRTNTALADMVRSEGAILVDAYARFSGHEGEYVDQDGLHLRPAGYEALARAFFDVIKARVTSTPAVRIR